MTHQIFIHFVRNAALNTCAMLCLCAAGFGLANRTSAQIVNGSFETPPPPVGGFLPAGTVPGWTVGGWSLAGSVVDNDYLSFSRLPAVDGRAVVGVTQGSISQTDTLTVGQNYLLSFYYSGLQGAPTSYPNTELDVAI